MNIKQSYDSKFLKIYPNLPPTPLQLEEDLEQLKVLENGFKMKVISSPSTTTKSLVNLFCRWVICSQNQKNTHILS